MRPRPLPLATLAATALLAACASEREHWYKGNTHAHTVLCGHADSSPEAVARWYLDHGFHFLVLSEHNLFIDPASVRLPADRRDDFILVPGEEITGNRTIHTTGMNLDGLVDWTFDSEHKSAIIQSHTDGAIAAGGVAILNHPNFGWAVAAEDILPVERLHMFELFNGHPAVHNHGDATHDSTEELWDVLLGAGMVIYGVSSDDMHELETWGPGASNPGRGWVMVRASELTPGAITGAMERGAFYASSGVILEEVVASPPHGDRAGAYVVAVDEAATREELTSELLSGHRASDATEGFTIEWIGPGGVVLATVRGTRASHAVEPGAGYVRCKVSYVRRVAGSDTEAPQFEEFYAWTQPVFTDGRRDRLATAAAEELRERARR